MERCENINEAKAIKMAEKSNAGTPPSPTDLFVPDPCGYCGADLDGNYDEAGWVSCPNCGGI